MIYFRSASFDFPLAKTLLDPIIKGMLRPRSPVLVHLIITLNVIVFLMWGFFPPQWMLAHFAVSWEALEQGRYWVLLTSVFSHSLLIHLLINMFVLFSFGRFLEQILGRRRFLTFYLVAGVVGSLSHALLSNYYIHRPDQAAVGASGAIAGLILLFSLLFPKEKILVFGLIPVPALFGALAFIALDLWGLVEQSHGGGLPIGHGAHLGGAATGIIFYFLLRSKRNF